MFKQSVCLLGKQRGSLRTQSLCACPSQAVHQPIFWLLGACLSPHNPIHAVVALLAQILVDQAIDQLLGSKMHAPKMGQTARTDCSLANAAELVSRS